MFALFCVKDSSQDSYVSKHIASGNGWELEEVSKVIEAMYLHSDAVFLGIQSDHKKTRYLIVCYMKELESTYFPGLGIFFCFI